MQAAIVLSRSQNATDRSRFRAVRKTCFASTECKGCHHHHSMGCDLNGEQILEGDREEQMLWQMELMAEQHAKEEAVEHEHEHHHDHETN